MIRFPVYSTSVFTRRMQRVVRVMHRTKVARQKKIRYVGVYNCRKSTETKWSAHAFGDAGDFMTVDASDAHEVARAIVHQATKRTVANRGRRLKNVVHVIGDDQEWVRGIGWRRYGGTRHWNHAHGACRFSTEEKPPCAG